MAHAFNDENREYCASPQDPPVGCRVLVADDNEDSAVSLGKMLEMVGHCVRVAYDGLAAVEIAATFHPDVAILDIGMPKLNGCEAARRLREQPWSEHLLLVALTGWAQEEDYARTKEAGFDHHLVKPVKLETLETVVASAKTRRLES